MKEIIIDLNPDGSIKIDAKGFTGNACEAATKPLLDALRGDAESIDVAKKPEAQVIGQIKQNLTHGA